jgi:aspartyl aminopeptidase
MVKEEASAPVDPKIAKALLDFINASWTPYHAVGK